jgi:FMN-dependent NADH-azoreductase
MTSMQSILVIKASPRGERSGSRKLADEFLAAWKAAHPGGAVKTLDLGVNPPPAVSEEWIEGAFRPPSRRSAEASAAIRVSDEYVDGLLAASEVVIATPVHNFGIPAPLKLWIDQIVRIGRTFSMEAGEARGLAGGRNVKALVTSGWDLRPGRPMEAMNFVEPYLRGIFQFIGVTKVEIVYAYNQAGENREAVFTQALTAVRALAAV